MKEAMIPWFRLNDAPGPVDVKGRRAAAVLLRKWANGQITNDELENQWPRTSDEAVEDMRLEVWFTYDDSEEHRFDGAPTSMIRWADFLETDQPYVWKQPGRVFRLVLTPVSFVSLGLVRYLFDPVPPEWPYPPRA